jgi:hypothetical protein
MRNGILSGVVYSDRPQAAVDRFDKEMETRFGPRETHPFHFPPGRKGIVNRLPTSRLPFRSRWIGWLDRALVPTYFSGEDV